MLSNTENIPDVSSQPQRAILTGATGYVGSWLLKELTGRGWKVHTLGRNVVSHPSVSAHHYDGTIKSVFRAIEAAAPDIVFHLASAVVVDHTPDNIAEILNANVAFPTFLLEAMVACDCHKLINTGTSWQHFDSSNDYNPTNLYAATKQAFEDIAMFYVNAKRIDVINLRLFDVYGPYDPRRKLIPYLVRSALRKEPVVLSPGQQTIDPIHIKDVVSGYMRAVDRLLSNSYGMEVFPVRSGQIVSIRELVDQIGMILGAPVQAEWGGRPYRDREVMKPWIADDRLPGWSPTIDLDTGLRELIEAAAHEVASNER